MKKNKNSPLLFFTGKKLPSILYVTIGFFLVGSVFGCITAHLLKTSLYAPLLSLYQTLDNHLKTSEVDWYAVFQLSAQQQIKLFLLLWFFSCTNVWRWYLGGFTVYSGFCTGLLLGFCTLVKGGIGFWDFLCFQMPQALFFVPAYCLTILHCQQLYMLRSSSSHSFVSTRAALSATRSGAGKFHQKKQLILHQLPCFLFDITLLLLGCLLEGYFNLPLLRFFVAT